MEKADQSALRDPLWRVTVGSVQSMYRPARLEKFKQDYYSLIIVDEAHHALAKTYLSVLDYFDTKVLGVTATPDRGDQRNMGEYFDSLAFEYPIAKAIKDGYLSKIYAHTIPLKIDLTEVKVSKGDYDAQGIDYVLTPYLEAIAKEMKDRCQGRKNLVFLPLIKTSQIFRDILNDYGFRACEVNGTTENRKEILDDYASGKYDTCCNAMLLTEGYDCPPIDCVVPLRPTKISSLYRQMIGRGTRVCEGKTDLLVLDFLWLTKSHALSKPSCLIATDQEQADKMDVIIDGSDEPKAIDEVAEEAEVELNHDREIKLAEELKRLSGKRGNVVNPVEFAMAIHDQSLANYEPTELWERERISIKQQKKLIKAGFDYSVVKTAGHAEALLNKVNERKGKASPMLIARLSSYGFQDVANWSMACAKRMNGRIAMNGHSVPYDINPRDYKGY